MGYGKHQKSGPYAVNGYRPNKQVSHLDFIPSEHVYYIGTNKNKSKFYIPNGTEGVILDNDSFNKLQKIPRSFLKVDFGKKGVHYVHKDVLQHVEDYGEYIEKLVETPGLFDGYQRYRNENKKDIKDALRPERYEEILKNRKGISEFREWRKDYLRTMESDLYNQLDRIQLAPEYKSKVELRKKLKTEYDELLDKYTDKNIVTNFEGKVEEKQYNLERTKGETRIKVLKDDLYIIQLYFDNSSAEMYKINELLHSKSKQYVRNVSSRQDYNNYLHCIKNGYDYDYKQIVIKPSRDYKVIQSDKVAKEPKNLDLLLWGLNPCDVIFK